MLKGNHPGSWQVRAFFTVTALLTWLVNGAELTSRMFHLVRKPTSGPQRLDQGWQEKSLLHCAIACQERYRFRCWSLMYNNSTHLCTPGKWLEDNQAPPSTAEGALYLSYQCDTHMGFTIRNYNETPVCILRFSTEVTYAQATSSCRSLNSYLYTTKTLDKFYFLQTLVASWLWVGLDDVRTEGQLVWVDDGLELDPALIPYIFSSGEPNDNSGLEDCVEIFVGTRALNDNSCDKHFQYVCEQPM